VGVLRSSSESLPAKYRVESSGVPSENESGEFLGVTEYFGGRINISCRTEVNSV